MKKKGLGRRYNKYLPKLTIPLEDQAAVYKLPNTKYEKPDHQVSALNLNQIGERRNIDLECIMVP